MEKFIFHVKYISLKKTWAFAGIITKNRAEPGRPYIMEHKIMQMIFDFLTGK